MPFPQEHSARIKSPGIFKKFTRKNNEGGEGVDFIFGIRPDGKSEIQAIRFDRKRFTVEKAKQYLKDHDFKTILFEKATLSKTGLGDLSDKDLIFEFARIRKSETDRGKALFREALGNRDLDFFDDLTPTFCELAKNCLPEILDSFIKQKDIFKIFSGEKKIITSYKDLEPNWPYLVREPNSEVAKGVVRVGNPIEDGSNLKIYRYPVKDFIPFENTREPVYKSAIVKIDNEKMEMFSVVYKSADAWGKAALDSDDEFMTEEEIRKAVNWANFRGMGLDIEHEKDQIISREQAFVAESYQARASWKEENLEVRKGDWVSKTKFNDRKLWEFAKLNFETYSMEGSGDRVHDAKVPELADG